MRGLGTLIWRDTNLFFKDNGMFFTSMVTPLILLLLFVTFLGNVYRESFSSLLDACGVAVDNSLMEGFVGGWLFSSLLAVCCVTVAFCSNMLMVQDKVTGARMDLTMAPVKSGTLAMGYYISTALSTLLICLVALAACCIYLGKVGWYLSWQDLLLTCLDVFLLTMFGTALSSVVNHFLSTQGQMSAVGTIVSAGYGFICGAYHADFAVFRRYSEVHLLSAGNLWHGPSSQPSDAGHLWRTGRTAAPAGHGQPSGSL